MYNVLAFTLGACSGDYGKPKNRVKVIKHANISIPNYFFNIFNITTHPLRAISISLFTPECSNTSACLAWGSKVTLKVNDFVVLKPVSTCIKT